MLCISFTEDHLKDGMVIAEADMAAITALNGLSPAAVQTLVEHRGLDRVNGGYEVHNYRSRGKLSRLRAQAGRLGGVATAMANEVADDSANESASYGVGVGVVKRIFEKWCNSLGDRRVSLTPGRLRVIRARLRDGYSEADLIDAAQGWQNDSWAERPRQNDLLILFRNGEQVEKFRDLWRSGRQLSAPTNRNQSAAAGWDRLGRVALP